LRPLRVSPIEECSDAASRAILRSALADPTNLRLHELLGATAQELVSSLDADACTVSRVIGDVLILVTERAPEGRTLLMGQGYLVPDYPLTQEVLASGLPRALTLADVDVDPAEATVLHELGFASLLILPLPIAGARWGLVEVYRLEPRPFDENDMRVAGEILARTSARVAV
jgi:GAF domain-containing protein